MRLLRLVSVAALLWTVSWAFTSAQTTVARPAPHFALKDQNAKPLNLPMYRGKVILLNFWATWCAPCRVEMPWFEEFSNRYRDRGLVVVGLSMDDEGWKTVRPVLGKLKVTYPIGLGNQAVAKLYGVTQSLPVTFLIDRNGKIQAMRNGFGKKPELEKLVEDQLSK